MKKGSGFLRLGLLAFIFGGSLEILMGAEVVSEMKPPSIEEALKEKNPLLLGYSFVAALGKGVTLSDKASLETIQKLNKRSDFNDKLALLLTYRHDTVSLDALIKTLSGSRSLSDRKLAASIYATAALGEVINEKPTDSASETSESEPPEEEPEAEGKEAKKNKAKAKKPKKKKVVKVSRLSMENLPKLIADKDSTVSALATMAAAYFKDEGSADAVTKLKSPREEQAGAVLLYKVRIGQAMDEKEFESLWSKAKRGRGLILSAQPKLFRDYILPPGASLACQAFGEDQRASCQAFLEAALKIKDVRVQIDAIRAIGRIGDENLAKLILEDLNRYPWPVLVEACKVLGEIPLKASIEALIKRLKKEEGRFRLDVEYALSCIAGADHGNSYKGWYSWWKKNEKTFRVDHENSRIYRESKDLFSQGVSENGFFMVYPFSVTALVLLLILRIP